jgi:hypothetical protein
MSSVDIPLHAILQTSNIQISPRAPRVCLLFWKSNNLLIYHNPLRHIFRLPQEKTRKHICICQLIISHINKQNKCYRRSFFSNHFLRAVISMATNILAFLSSSKSSQASKKSSSSMSGTSRCCLSPNLNDGNGNRLYVFSANFILCHFSMNFDDCKC